MGYQEFCKLYSEMRAALDEARSAHPSKRGKAILHAAELKSQAAAILFDNFDINEFLCAVRECLARGTQPSREYLDTFQASLPKDRFTLRLWLSEHDRISRWAERALSVIRVGARELNSAEDGEAVSKWLERHSSRVSRFMELNPLGSSRLIPAHRRDDERFLCDFFAERPCRRQEQGDSDRDLDLDLTELGDLLAFTNIMMNHIYEKLANRLREERLIIVAALQNEEAPRAIRKSHGKPGRPPKPTTDPNRDKQLAEGWRNSGCKTLRIYVDTVSPGVTVAELKEAIDRHRKREKSGWKKPSGKPVSRPL